MRGRGELRCPSPHRDIFEIGFMTRRRIGGAVWLPCHQEPATSMVPAFAPARRGRYRLPPALLLAAHSRSRAVILEDPVPGPGHHSGSQRRDLARLVNGFARLL